MRLEILALAVAVSVAGESPCQGRWGSACAPSVEGYARGIHVYRWEAVNESQHLLYLNERMVGGYDHEAKHFLPWREGKWGTAEPCPLSPPSPPAGFAAYMAAQAKDAAARLGKLPTGVMLHMLSPKERWTYMGEECPKEKVYEGLAEGAGADKLHDDSKKPTVSVIGGSREEQTRILDHVTKAMPGRFKVWEGPKDDWSFEPGFKRDGHPHTLYVQAADGTVLHRQDDLDGGLDKAIEAIRKACPDYDPKKDPDLRKPQSPNGGGFQIPAPVALGGAGAAAVGAFLMLTQKKTTPRGY